MNTGYAAVNGLKMYYEVHGDGPGRPLVLLPGGVLTIELSFGVILPALAAGRRVIVTELQGHGRTADIDRDMSMIAFAGDVAGLLGQRGVAQADVFGFSLGGGVALQLALDYPELVGRLIVASAGYNSDGTHPEIMDPVQWATSTRMPTAEDFRQMQEAYARVAPDPGHFDAFRARTGQAAGSMSWTPAELGRIGAPTLLIFGDHDFIKLEHAVEMAGLIPGAQLAVLPGATHMDVLRRADLMISLIQGFLG
ncbi:MAG TPA: alpha/beta hydrolase [Streptosporangiaceae bacterium]|nr:alpha/beta hydrolase [Streptosporangiaceae bacterium]